MKYDERALCFDCAGERLIGVLCEPLTPLNIGIVIVVGGPQYRVGSHRQFVVLARSLATAGFAVLRFDYRGMGDASGSPHNFQAVSDDIQSAIDALQRSVPAISHVVLWGLCDGASAALLYLRQTADRRVAGLCLVNPWIRSDASLARTHVKHYYKDRLRQREFWLKLLRGRVAGEAVRSLISNVRATYREATADTDLPFQSRMAGAWSKFDGEMILILSGNDYTAKEFIEFTGNDSAWSGAFDRAGFRQIDLPDADHTISESAAQREMIDATIRWLQQLPLVFSSRSDSHLEMLHEG